MSVTIGEFEVLPEPPPATPPAAPAAAAPAAADPAELARLLQQLQEQALRTWAH